MPVRSKLIAWVKPYGVCQFLASFVGGGATLRPPATQLCTSLSEARQWIEGEAAQIGAPIAWLSEPPDMT